MLSVLADLEWPAVLGITVLAWAIAATVEWLAWQPGAIPPAMSYSQPAAAGPPIAYAKPPREPEPPAESPSDDAEPAAPPVTERRERRSWLPQIRRRPRAPDAEPPEPRPDTVGAGLAPPVDEVEPRPDSEPPGRPPLQAVDTPAAPEPPSPAPAAPPDTSVVRMSSRRAPEPREWNLWELESIAREEARMDPARRDEWSYLFLHLRQFADAEGTLPSEFDGLVRESFGELLER